MLLVALKERLRTRKRAIKWSALAIAALTPLTLQTEKLAQAKLAIPRISLAEILKDQDVRLFKPLALGEIPLLPSELDKQKNPKQHALDLEAASQYLRARIALRSTSAEPKCKAQNSSPSDSSLKNVFCLGLKAKWLKLRGNGNETSTTSKTKSKKERREAAQALTEENWAMTSDYSYRELVGIVSVIPSFDELIRVGSNLAKKSNCVGSPAATALGYKLEEHFPNEAALQVAKDLYEYASRCGNDFASATAAYRLSLLDIMGNNCKRVPDLMRKVESIADAHQFQSRARYWRAYCAETLGDREESRAARELLAKENTLTFHNLAANAAQSGALDWVTRNDPTFYSFRSLIRPEWNNHIKAFELLRLKKRPDLAGEWVELHLDQFQQFEPEVQIYIADSLSRDGSILTSFRFLSPLFQDFPRTISMATMRLFYPMKYFDLIEPRAGEGLDPLLVLALVRQESAFNPDARSRVGARGLMQVMPATARMISRVRRANLLLRPSVNIEVGTKYFKKRLSQFSGDVEMTLAAYNAGAGRVEDWRKRYVTSNKILFMDLIPYRETREYVANILRNYYWYTRIYSPSESEKAKPFVDSSRTRSIPEQKADSFQKRAPSTLSSKEFRIQRELAIARGQAGSIDNSNQ